MRTFIVLAVTALLAQQAYTPTAAAAPSTDIYLGTLETVAGVASVTDVVNLTDRDGYDNQPAFAPDGTMLYTSARDASQTDIYRYDVDSGTTRQVTRTISSEYSATPLPTGAGFSSIHEGPGVQALWRYGADGASHGGILDDVQPVGYHAWADDNIVVMFVLGGDGNPDTLQVGDLRTGDAHVIAENPGRSLHKVPGRRAVSFVRKIDDDNWWIEVIDFGPGIETSGVQYTRLIQTPAGHEDYAWTPDGRLLMGAGSKLFQARPGEEWVEIADLEVNGVSDITRLAVNADGTRIAIVGAR